MSAEVKSTVLSNGLTVLTKEIHDAPVATFWVWYRVGGRNELSGITGISHWVEHMLFKGTPTFKKGDIFRSVTKNGGTLNGFTWIDYTTYFETLPADRIDLSLRIESDRMVNSLFDPDEVASERTVIISEREGSENYPTYHLGEEVNSLAFKVHPYGQGVIGWKSDLQAITREDLYGWYKKHYSPNNAVAVAVGDFSSDQMLARIEELFGSIPRGPEIAPLRSIEPPQIGERRVTVRLPGPTRYFEAAYHTPSASHEDVFPLIVLDAVLSGAKSMGMGGREGALGRSSRLYRSLVESGLTSGVGSSFALTRDPYLLGISATLRPGIELGKVEEAIFGEVSRIEREGVTAEELERARKGTRAQLVYGSEGVTSQAYWLGNLEMVANHKLFDDFLDKVEKVTSDDVSRVAKTYFGETNRTVGWFEPTDNAGMPVGASGGSAAVRPYFYLPPGASSGALSAQGAAQSKESGSLSARRETLSNGIAVIGHESSTSPVVVVRAMMRSGAIFDPADKPGLAVFTARMMQRGTKSYTFQELNALTDSLGAALSVDALSQTSQVTFRCLREDLPKMVEVVSEILRAPTFPESELVRFRGEVQTRLREQENDTGSVAERLFFELAYPQDHPYHHWYLGSSESVGLLTRDDIVAFHARYIQPNSLSVSFSGDVRFEEMSALLEKSLGDCQPTAETVSIAAPEASRPDGVTRRYVGLPGKSQTDITMGLPAISRKDPDFYALSFADLVLGGLGLMGRLGDVVRDKMGLAYHVSCSLDSMMGPGAWQIHAGVNPKSVDSAIEAVLAEVRRIQDEPITDDEIADGKSYLTGILPLALETNSGIARTLQQIELYDLGLDYLDRYRESINSLTKEEIQAAARRYFSADNLIIVVAGPEEAK